MIYLFYGNDIKKRKEAYEKLKESLGIKEGKVSFFTMDDYLFEESKLEEYIFGRGLFESQFVVVLRGVLEDKEAEDFVLSSLDDLKKSPNIFIFLETAVSGSILSRFKKVAEKVEEFKQPTSKTQPFKLFSLTDAFSRKDKKKAWVLYQKALSDGAAPEEMVNLLFWQIKAMLLVKGLPNSPAEIKKTGLHPFVFKKSLSFSSNFTTRELRGLSSRLLSIFHENRRTNRDLGVELERFILETL